VTTHHFKQIIAASNRNCPGQSGGDMHPTKFASRKMLNTAEAASYCGSSESTFNKLRLLGGGPVFVKFGRRVVYDPADLDRWLSAHRRASSPKRVTIEPGAVAELV
jgi:predicted DNA-binding transcriptional regulator AlpA